MRWKSLLFRSASLALMLETTACGLYTSGIGTEDGAGGAGGAASSSAQSASSGSGTSSSSGSSAENCFDNKDNDTNMQIDCADPGCKGIAQCEAMPAGWTLVWALLVGDASTPPATCADLKTLQTVYFTQPGTPATCTGCVCDAAGGTCTAPEISCYYNQSNCTGGSNKQQPSNTSCIDLPGVPSGGSNPSGSCNITAQGKFSGACNATGGAPTVGPKWGGAVFVCPSVSFPGGCVNGQDCIPVNPSVDGKVCIKKDGTDACPSGWTNEISAFKDGDDTRTCSQCQCAGACTGGGYVLHDLSGCGDNSGPFNIPNNNTCVMAPDIFDQSVASLTPTLANPGVGMCSGGQPQGAVTGKGDVKICCK